MDVGRCSGSIALPLHKITARSITFCNSLMLPSHLCISNSFSTSRLKVIGDFPIFKENALKMFAQGDDILFLSRNGGKVIGNTCSVIQVFPEFT